MSYAKYTETGERVVFSGSSQEVPHKKKVARKEACDGHIISLVQVINSISSIRNIDAYHMSL